MGLFSGIVNLGKSLVKGAISLVGSAVQLVSVLASAIIGKPKIPNMNEADTSIGNRLQVPPATSNKLPVIYGTAFVGGTITDLTITNDNQTLYYVLSLCEVTNTESGTPDTISFGKIYWGGKLCVFGNFLNTTQVTSLIDESTGVSDTSINNNLFIYLYRNGSYTPANSTTNAITVMSDTNVTPTARWDANKLMTNCAFAIVKLKYNADAGVTGIQQTKFQVTNSRSDVGDCLYDYLNNSRYGAAIPASQIDTVSLSELSAYSNELMTFTPYNGGTATIQRFRFDGVIETSRAIQSNMQAMSDCCDCLIRYNEITAKWGVIVQKPTYTVVMDLNDSNIVSAITITPIETASTYNIAEVQFADSTAQDTFNSVTIDLAEIDPSLLNLNEPVNKQSISLPLVNDNVRAQYLATRFLKACREDLQVSLTVMFVGLQLEAGDIVTITNEKYGWSAKPFRIRQVRENFAADGVITVSLNLMEFNATIYNDVSITQFTPAPNSGLPDATVFGTIPAPTITTQYPTNINPFFLVNVTASSSGVIQYAEVWYSAFSNPTASQLIFAGTTAINSSGTPYTPSDSMGTVSIANIPSGNWYFFTRMVNSLASSSYSPASSVFAWRPSTYQYAERYLMVAYATSITGAGFSTDPRGKTYYGLLNQSSTTPNTDPSAYTWYLAEPNFGTAYYLCYSNRTGRKFSFDTGLATYAGGSGAFVPLQTSLFDPSTWSALPDGTNFIDLDHRTGQLLETGTTTIGTGEIAVTNNPDGKIVASLQQFLDFGAGVYTYTGSAATLTIDIYGRVVGFTSPDNFYFTKESFTATSGQTVFTPTARASGYITGQDLVFVNGVLINPTSDYTETSTTVTLNTGATVGSTVTIISFRSVNSVTSVAYPSFTRNVVSLTSASSYTASGFTLNSGYELLFVNGAVLSDLDYDISGQTINNFPSTITGDLTIIQWSANNLGVPNGTPVNQTNNTVIGQATYPFSFDVNAFNLYNNGILQLQGTDYTTGTNQYTLTTTPDTITNLLQQQTFARTGSA